MNPTGLSCFHKNEISSIQEINTDNAKKEDTNNETNTDEDIAIEEIVEKESPVKPKVVPVTHHKEAV